MFRGQHLLKIFTGSGDSLLKLVYTFLLNVAKISTPEFY